MTAPSTTNAPADVCCAPVLRAPLDEADAEEVAAAFKVLADPVRLRLLSLIASRDRETCACELVEVLDRKQPTISHHLSVLHDAGLLAREKRGRWVWYRTVPERLAALRDSLAPR
jgi:ArsR family transcriptional regulator